MAQQPIKLVLSDIDGTIVPFGQATVSQKTVEAFHACMDAGLEVGVASGRIQPVFKDFFMGDEECGKTGLAINGMEVYLRGECIYRKVHSEETLNKLRELIRETPGSGMFIMGSDTFYILEKNLTEEGYPPIMRQGPEPFKIVEDELPEGDVIKLNIFVGKGQEDVIPFIKKAKERIPELDFLNPMPGGINVSPAGWSKASAIDVLLEAMGIGLDEVCVFGDAYNDLPMIEHVPCSVAVANAVPDIAKAATYHIGACEDDAVADAMFALARGEFPFTD